MDCMDTLHVFNKYKKHFSMLPFILWLMMMYSDLQCYVLCVMLMYSCLCSITTRLRSCAGRRTETTTPSWGASCSTLASPSRTPATTTSPTSTSSETTRLYWRYSGNTTQKLTGPGTFYKNPSTRESLHKWNKRLRFITDEIAILITTLLHSTRTHLQENLCTNGTRDLDSSLMRLQF